MDLNLTLIGEMITFLGFVWFTMKFVWPPLVRLMEERTKKIADGLAAAEQGVKELELANYKVKQILTEAKAQGSSIIEKSHQRANHIIEEAKLKAQEEGKRLIVLAENDIEQKYNLAKNDLLSQVSSIAIAGAEKILRKEVDKSSNDRLMQELVGELE